MIDIPSTFKLYVKTQDEKVIELHLIESNTIHEVKQMVQKRTYIPVHKQCLLFVENNCMILAS